MLLLLQYLIYHIKYINNHLYFQPKYKTTENSRECNHKVNLIKVNKAFCLKTENKNLR